MDVEGRATARDARGGRGVGSVADVVILNGGSSSGKSSIARCLQDALPSPWLRFSIDDLIDAMPDAMLNEHRGLQFGNDGSVRPGSAFRALESAWMHGIAEMARRGAGVIVDDAFVSGMDARDRWQASLDGVDVLWVGVFCDPDVAAARERERGDRIVGMAVSQAIAVHVGMTYDVTVDTSEASSESCARVVARRLAG